MPRPSLRILLLIVLPLAAYACMLSSPFKTMDDKISITNNTIIRHPGQWKQYFLQGYFGDNSYYRPLPNLSYMAEYHIVGAKPFFYNLDNLLIHIINAFLVWVLVSRLSGNPTIGFWTALLFAVHPIHWEAVANISGRAILLCGSFIFLSFLAWLTAYARRHSGWLALSLFAFAAALLCKEGAAVFPGVLFLYLLHKRAAFKDFVALAPYAVIVGAYLFLRHSIGVTELYQWRNLNEYALGFTTFLRSVITHIRLFVLPVDLHFDRSASLFTSLAQPQAMVTLFFWLVAASWLLIGGRHITGLVWLCLGWFAVELLPVSQLAAAIGVGPGYISTAEHFLYIASVPAFMLMTMGGVKIYELTVGRGKMSQAMFTCALAAVFVFWMSITVEQSIYASNEISMVERSLRLQPDNARMHFSAGMAYVDAHKYKEAEGYFRAAVALQPYHIMYRISLGKSLCDQGRYAECLAEYDKISDAGMFVPLLNDNRRAAQAHLKHADLLQK